MLRSSLRTLAVVAAFIAAGAYGTIMWRGPQGISALREKHREIRALEEQHADLAREIEAKKQRIARLKTDSDTQELEIRKRLKMQHEGDTQFVLPDAPRATGPAASTP